MNVGTILSSSNELRLRQLSFHLIVSFYLVVYFGSSV